LPKRIVVFVRPMILLVGDEYNIELLEFANTPQLLGLG